MICPNTPRPCRMGTLLLATASLLLSVVGNATAQTVTLDFNDGTANSSVGAFYTAQGVTFTNTRWDNFVSTNEGLAGVSGLKIVAVNSTFLPKQATALIATFSTPVSFVSIRGVNVGDNGARIDAFNATIAGTLLGFDQTSTTGAGVDNHPLLSVNAAGIRRIELYQPFTTSQEGMLWDNLTFTVGVTSTPEPAGIAFLSLGLLPLLNLVARRTR